MRDKMKYKFIDALSSDSVFKLDIIKYLHDKFVDISIMYDIRDTNGVKTNMASYDVRTTLENDIRMYTSKKKHFKVLKRKMSLLKYDFQYRNKKGNAKKIIILSRILNGQLGQIYQVKTMIETLLFLMDNFNYLDKKRINANVDLIIEKLSYIYNSNFVKNEKEIVGDLMLILKGKSIGAKEKHILRAYNNIEDILNSESKKFIF